MQTQIRPTTSGAGTTVFTDARLIVGDGSTVLEDAVITVQDGIVVDVATADREAAGRSAREAQIISCGGRTVMPALVNPHGHIGYMRGTVCDPAFYSRDNVIDHLRRFVYHGVSTFQSLGTDLNGVEVAVRDDQRSGLLDDPDLATLFTAGAGIVAAPSGDAGCGAPFFAVDAVHQATGPEDARAFVRRLAAQRVDAVKFWIDDRGGQSAKLTAESSRVIVEEAHEHGLPAAAHIYSAEDAMVALDAGADILAHMPRTPEPDRALLDRLVEQNVAVFTSMTVQGPARTAWLDDPLVAETLPEASIDDLRARMAARAHEPLFDTGKTYRTMRHNFEVLHEAGVRLVYLADTGVFAQLPGIAEHRELEALVDAGLSPLEAIEFATRRSSELLGLTDRGLVEAGRRADFLVLDADPLADIAHTRRIAAVVLEGRVVDREKLSQQLLAAAR
ncbi:amidohydrolase family protein [Kribbella sp. CA-253562]|uniref:amidohydrolase family protein n=1 Tax=Kribbella sp. CA-253562 TaxID=3239942 RepID=UPI003D8C159D